MTTQHIASEQAVPALPITPPVAEAISVTTPRKKGRAGLVISYIILIAAVIFALYPVYYAALASLRAGNQLFSINLADQFLPTGNLTLENYKAVLADQTFKTGEHAGDNKFLTFLKNSLVVALLTSGSSVVIATSAAFVISRFRFRARNALLILFLAIQAFPGILALGPITLLLESIGLYRSHFGLVLAYTAGTLVFSTWNLKGYFDTIPVEIEESALMDGCNVVQSFFLVLLPLSVPAIAVTAFFGFLAGWGEFALASALVPAPDTLQLLPVALRIMTNDRSVPWGQFAAASLLVAIPTMIFFLLMQRYLQSGLTQGGVKG